MTNSLPSKTRLSNGFSGFRKQPSSPAVFEAGQSSDPPSLARGSTKSVQKRQRLRRLFRKSTSKLFGMVKIRVPSKVRIDEKSRQESPSGNACQHVALDREITQRSSAPISEPVARVDSCRQATKDVAACLRPNNTKKLPLQCPKVDANTMEYVGDEVVKRQSPRRSQSSPGLTDRFTSKISITFGHPTVVHRANLRHRPSLYNFSSSPQDGVSSHLEKLGDNTQEDSDPSTTQSRRGSSPLSQSTQPTSDDIHNSAAAFAKQAHPNKSQSGRESAAGTVSHCGNAQRSGKSQLIFTPSIVTVEVAASAKVFFETYFNRLFAGDSDRSRRQRELEEKLARLSLSVEEASRIRQAWCQQETNFLRQSRSLKGKSNSTGSVDNVSLAGFEVIKVLGKGSFGVVRLVKEKAEHVSQPNVYRTSNSSRSSLSNVRTSTFEALKSAVDANRSGRRRDLSKMKKEVYAMKVIRKSAMLRNCQEGHLRAERDFLVASEKSRWIIQLIASFQDAHNLYLVMDYMIGGDFMTFLIRRDILSEAEARWYIAEMILCVEESHRLGWIHRDVKPDNFLISASGHLKISDFGLAFDGHWSHDQTYYTNLRQSLLTKLGIKVLGDMEDQQETLKAEEEKAGVAEKSKKGKKAADAAAAEKHDQGHPLRNEPRSDVLRWRNRKERRKLARSVVGTSQYMAPEIVDGRCYDGRCDWWSIGVILYECLYGFTPFAAHSREHTKKNIRACGEKNHHEWLQFPMYRPTDRFVSADAIDLIGQLLQDMEYRLCSRKYMLNDYVHSRRLPGELLNHPADKKSKYYQGHYVYPNDASDIKEHPFFKRVRWDDIHNQKPPFVPKVKGWEDTKYFDDEQRIDDKNNDGSSDTGSSDEIEISQEPPDKPAAQQERRSVNGIGNAVRNGIAGLAANFQHNDNTNNIGKAVQKKKKKVKKRARDKVLRDEELGKVAMHIRKQSAFLGYSYRRPKDVLAALEMEPGRPMVPSTDGEAIAGQHYYWQ